MTREHQPSRKPLSFANPKATGIQPEVSTITAVQTVSLDGCGAPRPEADLVLQCARALLMSEERPGLEAALMEPLRWDEVARFAEYHCIMPVVAHVLGEYGGESVPHDVRGHLAQRLTVVARNNLRQVQEWRRVLDLLKTAVIPVISLKGAALALLAYQNVALREFLDLDLLIRPVDVTNARHILSSNGYQLNSPLAGARDSDLLHSPNRQLKFVNAANGTTVEVHWAALPAMLPFQMAVDLLFGSARDECQDGMSFLSLSREHLLVFLCAHGTKHCWMRLHWLCDLAYYLQRFPDIDWELCTHLAEAMNCGLVLRHSLLLAQQVLGLRLPPAIDNHVREDPESRRLADVARRFLFHGDCAVGDYAILRYYMGFGGNWRDQLDVVFQRIFVPDTPEWEAVRLPYSLSFLYYLVRPLRFVLQRLSNRAAESPTATTLVYAGQGRFDNESPDNAAIRKRLHA